MKLPFLSLFRAALTAPGNQPSPPDPAVPGEIIRSLENDFVLTDVEWNRDYQKIVQAGLPAFNGVLKYVADRPWLTLSPLILEQFLHLKGKKGVDNESLEKILARQQKMPEILQKLANEVNKGDPTHLSGDEWNNVLQKVLGPSGFSALTVFLPYMAQTGKTIDPEIKVQLQALASRGWVNRMVLDRIKLPPTLKDVRIRHRTKFDNHPLVIRIGECTRDISRLTIHIGTATVTIPNLSKGKNKDVTIYKKGQAKEYIVGEWKGKMTITVEDTGEVFEIEPEITIKGRPAPTQTFDLSQPTEERPVELPVPTPKPIPTGKEAKFTLVNVEVDDESFRQNQMRAESKSPQSAGEELLKQSQGRIKTVFERALKKVPSWNITKVDMTLTVNSQGRVTRIKFVPNLDNAPGGFIDGLRDITKYWLFPAGGEVKFPLVFQASGG